MVMAVSYSNGRLMTNSLLESLWTVCICLCSFIFLLSLLIPAGLIKAPFLSLYDLTADVKETKTVYVLECCSKCHQYVK